VDRQDNTLSIRLFDILKNSGILPGSIVLSKAGHDINRMYLVLSVKEKTAFLADGSKRTKEHPKKKRVTHLKLVAILQDWEQKCNQLDQIQEESGQNRLIQEWLISVLTKDETNKRHDTSEKMQ
jgi:ribosomal protein L14E/L6E/L27E